MPIQGIDKTHNTNQNDIGQENLRSTTTSAALGHIWKLMTKSLNTLRSLLSKVFFSIFPIKKVHEDKSKNTELHDSKITSQDTTSKTPHDIAHVTDPGVMKKIDIFMNKFSRQVDIYSNKYPGATDIGSLSNAVHYSPKEDCIENANEKLKKYRQKADGSNLIYGVEIPKKLENITRQWDDGICAGMGMMTSKKILLFGKTPRETVEDLNTEPAKVEAAGYQLLCEGVQAKPLQYRTVFICETLLHLKYTKKTDISNIIFLIKNRDSELYEKLKTELKVQGMSQNIIDDFLDTSRVSKEIKKIGEVKRYNLSPDNLTEISKNIPNKSSVEYIYLNALYSNNPQNSLFFKPSKHLLTIISNDDFTNLHNDLIEKSLYKAEGMDIVRLPYIFRPAETDMKVLENFKSCENGVYGIEIETKGERNEKITHHITFVKIMDGGKTTYNIIDPNDAYSALQFTDEGKALSSLNKIISEYELPDGNINHGIRVMQVKKAA